MKNIFKKDVYSFILIFVIFSSFVQLDLLGRGLRIVLKTEQPNVIAKEINPEVKLQDAEPTEIEITKLNLKLPVISVPLVKGTWEVHEGVANYAQGTSLINDKTGNVGLFAHDREVGFAKIKDLQIGDIVTVYGKGIKGTYKVNKTAIAKPIEVGVFYPTSKPQLTLVTCDGLFSDKRFVVNAELLKVEKN